jgi:hypothetical protein
MPPPPQPEISQPIGRSPLGRTRLSSPFFLCRAVLQEAHNKAIYADERKLHLLFSSLSNQLGQLLAGIKHAGLHGGSGDAKDERTLLDRLPMIVHQIDDRPMVGR